MRQEIRNIFPRFFTGRGATPSRDHMGLLYNTLAPVTDAEYNVPNEQREPWFAHLEGYQLPHDYAYFFKTWKDALIQDGSLALEGKLASRLLIGHGEASPVEVGFSFHHTWGTPIIPGSALKGLLANYIQATYGPSATTHHPQDPAHPEPERAPYQGVTWDGSKIKAGPGELYKIIFGAPEADDDDQYQDQGGAQGHVIFHDALVIPEGSPKHPFAQDVLTVHQKDYYAQKSAPTDHDDPNPVSYLTLKPKVRFLIALSGPRDWVKLTLELLKDALTAWGIGGKTSLGYGRFDEQSWELPQEFISLQERLETWLLGSTDQELATFLRLQIKDTPEDQRSEEVQAKFSLIQERKLADWMRSGMDGLSAKKFKEDYLPLFQAQQEDSVAEEVVDTAAWPELLAKAWQEQQSGHAGFKNTFNQLAEQGEFKSYTHEQLQTLMELAKHYDDKIEKFWRSAKPKDLSKKDRSKFLEPIRAHLKAQGLI